MICLAFGFPRRSRIKSFRGPALDRRIGVFRALGWHTKVTAGHQGQEDSNSDHLRDLSWPWCEVLPSIGASAFSGRLDGTQRSPRVTKVRKTANSDHLRDLRGLGVRSCPSIGASAFPGAWMAHKGHRRVTNSPRVTKVGIDSDSDHLATFVALV